MKKIIILLVIIIAACGVWYVTKDKVSNTSYRQPLETDVSATTTDATIQNEDETIIGRSAEGNPIIAYHYGKGAEEIIFVGGIHGGYEWNTVLVAQELVKYLEEHPDIIPENLKVTIIPVLNPDGLAKVVGTTTGNFTRSNVSTSQEIVVSGRFNGNNVDLNRNFDCDWQADATWQNRKVSGGDAAFSEPESQAMRDYIAKSRPKAVIAWYSSAGGVYASNCHGGVLSETREIMNVYAKASGYPAYDNFNFYEVTGDMTNWLAKMNIPSFSVLLTNHTDTEWTKNLNGIKALFAHYSN